MKIRKLLIFLLVISVSLSMGIIPAEAVTSENYGYTSNADGTTCTITGCFGAGGNIAIPNSLDGLVVKAIGDYSFASCTSLAGITIPNSVTSIGKGAFNGCTNLSSVTIPTSVTSIGHYAFTSCSGLTNIIIPDSVTSIGDFAFKGCSHLTDITISSNVTSIGDSTFSGCTSLTNIVIPNSVTTIQSNAFYCCTSLAGITIPNTVTSIGNRAFAGCTSLTNIVIPNSVMSIGSEIFSGCTSLTNLTIPNSVTNIKPNAFFNCTSLAGITIPNSVKLIDNLAFYGCRSLTNVTIPNSVTSIGSWAFRGCTSLNSVYFDGSMPNMNGYSDQFDLCSSSLKYYCPTGNPGNITLTPLTQLTTSAVTVNPTDNGTITPSSALGMAGETINLTITPAAGCKLKPGSLKYNDGSNHSISGTSFIMPDHAITISGVFVDINDTSPATYDLAISAGTGGSVTTGSSGKYAEGATINIAAAPSANYNFSGWSSTGGGSFASATSANTTFTMPAGAVSITANFTYNGSGGSSGSSGSGNHSSAGTVRIYTANVAGKDITGTNITATPLTVDVNQKTGMAALNVDSQQGSIIKDGGTVSITVPSITGVTSYTLGIPVAYLSLSDGTGIMTFNSDAGCISLPANMVAGIAGADDKTAGIAISSGDKSKLPEAVKTTIGDRPLVELSLNIDGKQIEWNNPKTPVTISIPYKPTAAELANPEGIVIWYIDGSGKAVSVPNGHYDAVTGTVTFTTTHFSYYAVGYSKVSFKDVAETAWYSNAINFIAARDITTGTGNGNFTPGAKLTRGQFIVMLMKAYGIAADTNASDNFTDAGNKYYTGYLAAAKRLGITAGVGGNRFAPDKDITRQEMFTLLYNALKVIDRLPEGTSEKQMSSFSDSDQVASWATDAMTLMVKTGVINGNGGKLTPTGATTRAEMAQVLCNLLQW